MSQDPLGFSAGDSNLYRYVHNQPTDHTDPSGKEVAFTYSIDFNNAANKDGKAGYSYSIKIGWNRKDLPANRKCQLLGAIKNTSLGIGKDGKLYVPGSLKEQTAAVTTYRLDYLDLEKGQTSATDLHRYIIGKGPTLEGADNWIIYYRRIELISAFNKPGKFSTKNNYNATLSEYNAQLALMQDPPEGPTLTITYVYINAENAKAKNFTDKEMKQTLGAGNWAIIKDAIGPNKTNVSAEVFSYLWSGDFGRKVFTF